MWFIVKYLSVICFLLNRRVFLDKLAQNSKKKHRRPAKYREMKAGQRKIRFDESFVERIFHTRYQLFVAFSSLQAWDAKTLDLIVKIVRVEVSVLATSLDIKK